MKLTKLILVAICAINSNAAETVRDPWLWPFAGGSIWNTPIGSEAMYVPAGFQAAKHVDVDVELLYRVASNAPTRTVYMPKSWETRAGGTQVHGSVQINDDIVVPDARKGYTPNNCAALLMPDGRTLKNINPLCRPEAGGPVFGYYCRSDTDLQLVERVRPRNEKVLTSDTECGWVLECQGNGGYGMPARSTTSRVVVMGGA